MRIGCLQFSPVNGDIDNNLSRADSVLSKANPDGLDFLVLPEMAFSGLLYRHRFADLRHCHEVDRSHTCHPGYSFHS
jgi:predicted amidohydrolase